MCRPSCGIVESVALPEMSPRIAFVPMSPRYNIRHDKRNVRGGGELEGRLSSDGCTFPSRTESCTDFGLRLAFLPLVELRGRRVGGVVLDAGGCAAACKLLSSVVRVSTISIAHPITSSMCPVAAVGGDKRN